jgi:hypothetical protein
MLHRMADGNWIDPLHVVGVDFVAAESHASGQFRSEWPPRVIVSVFHPGGHSPRFETKCLEFDDAAAAMRWRDEFAALCNAEKAKAAGGGPAKTLSELAPF